MLDPLPGRDKINARLTQLLNIGVVGAPQIGGNYYFHTRRDAGQNQPLLYVREGLHGEDRVLIDVNKLSADATVALDWWFTSDDGKYVAYGTSPSGSEESTLRILETATGRTLPDAIDRTRFASLAWLKDDSGFYYTRHPNKGDVPPGEEVYHVKVFFHRLGSDPAKDPLIYEDKRNPQNIPTVSISDDDRWLLINVEQGWTKTEMFLLDRHAGPNAAPVEMTTGKEFLYGGDFFEGKLYITTNEDAPHYRVFVADAAHPQRANWKELIPETDAVLQNASVTGGKLFVQYEHNVAAELKLFSLDGKNLADIPQPAIGNVFSCHRPLRSQRNLLCLPVLHCAPLGLSLRPHHQQKPSSGPRSTRLPSIPPTMTCARSGTTPRTAPKFRCSSSAKKASSRTARIPHCSPDTAASTSPCSPAFNRSMYLWMEHGGVYAVANLRGGSEFGEDWHRAGMLEKKQNVFDDFIAAAEYLISEKYTDKDHLAIFGGSNGGLLMGAMITQRPDLFRAVVCQVPLLDMLRYQNFQIAKLWIPEYGSADDPKQFNFIYAYSPYHHVKPGEEYPAILFMTADTDTRVDPMHAKKMTALMQAEAKNGDSKERPILLRIDSKAGHGQGKPVAKQVEDSTDMYSFLFWQLGVKP